MHFTQVGIQPSHYTSIITINCITCWGQLGTKPCLVHQQKNLMSGYFETIQAVLGKQSRSTSYGVSPWAPPHIGRSGQSRMMLYKHQ